VRRRIDAKISKYQPTAKDQEFMARRLEPFLGWDVGRYPLQHLLMEAYMQGIRDALEAKELRP